MLYEAELVSTPCSASLLSLVLRFAHPAQRHLGAFLLAAGLRAGVNLVIVALRITKKRGISGALILKALFGEDTARFGAMLGLFSFL